MNLDKVDNGFAHGSIAVAGRQYVRIWLQVDHWQGMKMVTEASEYFRTNEIAECIVPEHQTIYYYEA